MAEALAREFCRLGVADRAELVLRMREALGPTLDDNTATFYLDMSDWNLQAAVGFYLDTICHQVPSITVSTIADPPLCICPEPIPLTFGPSMCLLSAQPNDTVKITPGVHLCWVWSVMNTGNSSWPEGCVIRAVSVPETFTITSDPVVSLEPGKIGKLEVTVTTPASSGLHCQKYRIYTPEGVPFGESLWISFVVEGDSQPMLQQSMDSITDYNMC